MLNFKRHTVGSIARDTITAGSNFVRLGFNLIGATASVVKKGTELAIDATKQGYKQASTDNKQFVVDGETFDNITVDQDGKIID